MVPVNKLLSSCLGLTIAALGIASCSNRSPEDAELAWWRGIALDTIRPGAYVFCQPYSASVLAKSMKSLQDPGFKHTDFAVTEAEVMQTFRKYGGALIQYRSPRKVTLRLRDSAWPKGRRRVRGLTYDKDGYIYVSRTLDAIGVTDELIPAYNNSFYPRLAFIHEPKAKKGWRKGPQWSEVSTFVTTPICASRR